MAQFDMSDPDQAQNAMALLTNCIVSGSKVEIVRKSGRRTLSQNSALWLMFTQLADELNEKGLDQRKVLKESVSIPWSKDTICEFIWKPVQKAVVEKESTTDLTTREIDEVFAVLQRHLHQQFDLGITFPSIQTLINEQRI